MNQKGQMTVEVVLLAPLLVVLMFLIFEFGRVFGSWLVVTNAAREGTRFGITQPYDPSADAAIQARVAQTSQYLTVQQVACTSSNQPPSGGTSCIAITRNTDATGDDTITVLVVYKVTTLMPITGTIPFLGQINYPGSFPVLGLSTMRAQ